MNFIINRSTWRCGDNGEHSFGKGTTALINKEGYMCCLGQISLQLGCSKEDIFNESEPETVPNIESFDEDNILVCKYEEDDDIKNTELSSDAMGINDNTAITQEEREDQLRNLFEEYKHTIEFIGEGVKNK